MTDLDFQTGWLLYGKDSTLSGWTYWFGPFTEQNTAEETQAIVQDKYPEHEFELRPSLGFGAYVFQNGRTDFADGQPRDANPHFPGHDYHAWWDAGWGKADDERRAAA